MGRVEETYPGPDGSSRTGTGKVRVRRGQSFLERPVSKLVVIVETTPLKSL